MGHQRAAAAPGCSAVSAPAGPGSSGSSHCTPTRLSAGLLQGASGGAGGRQLARCGTRHRTQAAAAWAGRQCWPAPCLPCWHFQSRVCLGSCQHGPAGQLRCSRGLTRCGGRPPGRPGRPRSVQRAQRARACRPAAPGCPPCPWGWARCPGTAGPACPPSGRGRRCRPARRAPRLRLGACHALRPAAGSRWRGKGGGSRAVQLCAWSVPGQAVVGSFTNSGAAAGRAGMGAAAGLADGTLPTAVLERGTPGR